MSSPVVPSPRVAARTKHAVAVEQVHGEAVDLQFGEPRRPVVSVADLGHARLGFGDPGLQLLEREDVFEAVHALQVFDGGKRGGDFAAHFLRGRIIGHQLRMHRFDGFQPPVELVELGVGDDRRVLLVVRKSVFADLLHEVLVLRANVAGGDLLPSGTLGVGLCCGLPCAHRPILP